MIIADTNKLIILIYLWTIISIFLFSGCSIAGYGLGNVYDSGTAKVAVTGSITFDELKVDQRVSIALKNATILEGIYAGTREYGSNEELFLIITMGRKKVHVRYESIDQISVVTVKRKANGRVAGFLIGLGIDVFLIYQNMFRSMFGR